MTSDSFNQRIQSRLRQLENAHQRRERRSVEACSTTECIVHGQRCISFATNDYLGLTRHPHVLQTFAEVAAQQAGAGASALVAGRSQWHVRLEDAIAAFEDTESAILFPSGFAANIGTLTTLITERDAVFCDRENHASLIDGCRNSAGKFFVYERQNPELLSNSIARRRKDFDQLFIVTDSVFSMDGTLAALPELRDLAEMHDAILVVDEAHGTGVFGTNGRGVCELQNVHHQVPVRIGTLSKAIGGLGGFVAGSKSLCDLLWNQARSQFFSTALPPAVCAAALAALEVISSEPERRIRLGELATVARRRLAEAGFMVLFDQTSSQGSPIVAILLSDDDRAVRVNQQMLEAGFFIPAVRPPTVAGGTARLRMSICCDHTPEMIEAAVYQLREVLQSEQS